ncbi:MAG TPA: hypothetical protein DER05_08830 [Lutibacter sp.]|nr:hypothetical protein [Lutibacter sp.]
MKKFIYIAAISFSLGACGGGGDDPTPPPVVNSAPTVPTLTYPTNNLLCIDNVLNFQWNASTDSQGDPINYHIEVSKNTQFSPLTHNVTSTTTSKSITLEKGIAYYWRVKATDNKNASSNYSTTFSFYTEGVGVTNHLPFSPVLVSPTLNEVVHGAPKILALTWTASDVDTSDILTYDVYFGTDKNNLTIASPNQSAKTYSASLLASKTYYWKVTVKDNKGGQTVGQIWSFTTD